MHRVMMVSIALILVTGIARSTVAQPAADPEMLLGTLNVSSDYNAATQGLILIALLTLRGLTAARGSEQ